MGSGFRDLGFRVWGSGVSGLGFVSLLFGVSGLGFRVDLVMIAEPLPVLGDNTTSLPLTHPLEDYSNTRLVHSMSLKVLIALALNFARALCPVVLYLLFS